MKVLLPSLIAVGMSVESLSDTVAPDGVVEIC